MDEYYYFDNQPEQLAVHRKKVCFYSKWRKTHVRLDRLLTNKKEEYQPVFFAESMITVLNVSYDEIKEFLGNKKFKEPYGIFPVFTDRYQKEVLCNGTWVVKFREALDLRKANDIVKEYKGALESPFISEEYKMYLVRYEGEYPLFLNQVNALYQSDRVEFAYPNFINAVEMEDAVPTDNPSFTAAQQHIFSQAGIQTAWTNLQNSGITPAPVKVAVLDEGIYRLHDDLGLQKVVNQYDKISAGYNCPSANNNHGTSVAGIISAVNNSKFIVGVAYNALVADIRISYTSTNGTRQSIDSNVILGITDAINCGAKVINISWSQTPSDGVRDAIRTAVSRNIIVCCAAGNYRNTVDNAVKFPAFMAASSTRPVISVGACDSQGQVVLINPPTNNWGSCSNGTVTLTAPGIGIATLLSNGLGEPNFSGTSAATAFISGIVALMCSIKPNLTPQQARDWLISSKTGTGGVINAGSAMTTTITNINAV